LSHTAKPLNKLEGKKKWKWEEEHKKTFKELKDKITSQLVLALLKREGKIQSGNRFFKHTIRGVLLQEQEEKYSS